MKKTIKGLIKLTRFNEYVYFVTITTLLGVAAAGGQPDWRLFLILLPANWLAVGFAFMINDVEDAPDDILSKDKMRRNPISAGLISPKTARMATYFVGVFSISLYSTLGAMPLILGIASLILGALYSLRYIRLKTIAFFDIISHSLMLAGLQLLCGYFTYTSRNTNDWFWPFMFVVSISIYGELYNEIRDAEVDRVAKLKHTAIYLGEKATHILMISMLVLGSFSGFISLFVINLIPAWVLMIMATLAVLFIIPPVFKLRRGDTGVTVQGAFHKPLERAAAFALVLQYLTPWLDHLWNLGLF